MEHAALVSQQFSDVQPPPAANPTPISAAQPPSHPSYAEMITAAIQWGSSQGKEGGSSKRAIAKYIDRVYTNLPPSHPALLTHHLQRLKNSGTLLMVKNSYQLSSAVDPTPRSTPSADLPSPTAVPAGIMPEPVSSSVKRGPGRPPKLKPITAISSDPGLDNGSGSEPSKKRRGRPPKQQQGAVATEVPFVQPISEVQPGLVNGEAMAMASPPSQKRRGRPPKQLTAVVAFVPPAAPTNEVVKRQPGRPSKSNVVRAGSLGYVGRPRGRPRKNDTLGPVSSHVGKRSRGRPRKLGGGGGGAIAMAMVQGKYRGKGSGPRKMVSKRRSGRPVGRPRKDASILRNLTSDQERIANEELVRKFELIRSKIQEAVVVIRPCVAYENAALTALQQLEELTTLDLNAPPTDPLAPPPPPPTTTTILPQNLSDPPAPAVPISIAPVSTFPTATVTAPFMAAPPPFNATVPQMSGREGQHPMSWFSSNDAVMRK